MSKHKCESTIIWAVIRTCVAKGHEWIDTDTLGEDPEYSLGISMSDDQDMPDFAEANPFTRLARVEIKEIAP